MHHPARASDGFGETRNVCCTLPLLAKVAGPSPRIECGSASDTQRDRRKASQFTGEMSAKPVF